MKLDQPLSFRKLLIPWYDSDSACYATIAFLVPVLLFSLVGMDVAQSLPAPAAYLWVPVLLSSLSAIVLFTVISRMIRRRMKQSAR